MESSQEMPMDGNAEQVMDSLGEPKEASEEVSNDESQQGGESTDPLYVQKRLKQQKRAHEREIRELHAKIDSLSNGNQAARAEQANYESGQPSDVDEQIHKAVSYALRAKDDEERRAKEAQSHAHVQKQYGELNKHLDNVADKYDDFDEVVRGHDTPFTPHMRDAALMLDLDHKNPGSAGEVLYQIGKNREELERISKLHPLDQAREMVKLSKALIKGGESKASNNAVKPLGQIKNTPVTNSQAVNEKTPIGSIRQRMKSGNWK